MTVATFLCGHEVVRRFAGGDDAVVATATRAEYFGVVDKIRDVETQRIMTGLTRVACRDVCA